MKKKTVKINIAIFDDGRFLIIGDTGQSDQENIEEIITTSTNLANNCWCNLVSIDSTEIEIEY